MVRPMLSGVCVGLGDQSRNSGGNLSGVVGSMLILCTQNPSTVGAAAHTGLLAALWKKVALDQLLFNIYSAPVTTVTSTLSFLGFFLLFV